MFEVEYNQLPTQQAYRIVPLFDSVSINPPILLQRLLTSVLLH